MGFEICEQLGWRIPRHTVVPMASGSLLTRFHKAYGEFAKLELVEATPFSVHGAQGLGLRADFACDEKRGPTSCDPVPKPETIVKSLAIGTPADGYYAIHAMKQTGGFAEDVTDDEVGRGNSLLAECEGNFLRNSRWRHGRLAQETDRRR
jgi:threonine synthase